MGHIMSATLGKKSPLLTPIKRLEIKFDICFLCRENFKILNLHLNSRIYEGVMVHLDNEVLTNVHCEQVGEPNWWEYLELIA